MRETTEAVATLDATVAANCRAELARHQVRQRELAQRLGRTPTWLSRRLGGDVAFTLGELEAVAAALDVPLSRLLGAAA